MQVSPTISAAQAALLAATQHVVHASYVEGSSDVVDALQQTCVGMHATAEALRDMASTSLRACVVLQALEGLRAQLDDMVRIASALDEESGRLPIGTVDPVFEVLEDASDILYASRWG